ncbi:MAG: HlyD family efflux transporter periplasmic adaptor subunit [Agathobacter sp.]|nr:HlyD family efflux transporter periplasmic adaptor subunit [Agathobacter sp.]
MKNYLKKELKDRDNQLKYDFLPAMIEIIEKPANRMGVVILYTVIFLIVSTIIWACIMSIDVAVVASGTIDSDNPIITMSTLTDGTISEILVDDGALVKKGEVICKLSSEISQATLDNYEYNLEILQIQKEVYELVYSRYKSENYSKMDENIDDYGNNSKVAEAIILENNVFIDRLESLNGNDAKVAKESQLLTVIQNINSIDTKIESINAELEAGRKTLSDRTIVATESGKYTSVDNLYIGKNVATNDPIGYIQRDENCYKFSAKIEDEDITHLNEGDKVKLKISAFDDTQYEYIDGNIYKIGDIPYNIEGKGVVYDISIKLDSIPDNLKIGMEGNMDIIIGTRTVMEYFLEPFRKGLADSLKER